MPLRRRSFRLALPLVLLVIGAASPARPGTVGAAAPRAWTGERHLPVTPLHPVLPVKLPFVVPTFAGGFLLLPGEARWRAGLTHANVIAFSRELFQSDLPDPTIEDLFDYLRTVHEETGEPLFYFDGEVSRLELEWGRGFAGGWELGATLPVMRWSRGTFDHVIDQFHQEFGFSDSGRSSAPVNAAGFLFLSGDAGLELDHGDLGSVDLGDVTLYGRYALPLPGRRSHGEVGLFVELPTGDTATLAGSGGTDVAVEASFGWEFHSSRLTVGAGYALLGGLDAAPGIPVNDTAQFLLAWELRTSARNRILVELLHAGSPFSDLDAQGVSESSDLIGFGPRFEVSPGKFLDIIAMEDLLNHTSDLDVGLTVNFTWIP